MNSLAATTRNAHALPIHNIEDIKTAGALLAQTELFGTKNPAEGFVIAAMCHQDGVSFSEWMQSNHMIKGKVSKKADAMLADFAKDGGTYKIISRTPEVASVELNLDGNTHTSTLTWEEAQNEPFVYSGKEEDVVKALSTPEGRQNLKNNFIKPKYATPRARMQMLWARAVSDGVRTLDPAACCGTYTPEEVDDFTADVMPPPKTVPVLPFGNQGTQTGHDVGRQPNVIDAEATEQPPTLPATAAEPEEEPPSPDSVPCAADPAPCAAEAADTEESEYARCPNLPAFSAAGKPWSEVETTTLKRAYTSKHPALTAMHLSAIRSELASRGEEP